MPANVESMFSVRQMPWHREGEVLDDYPGTWAEARVLAGLDWDPVTTAVYTAAGINADGTPHYEPIDGWKSISRSDTGAVLSLNKDTYTVIDHAARLTGGARSRHLLAVITSLLLGGRNPPSSTAPLPDRHPATTGPERPVRDTA